MITRISFLLIFLILSLLNISILIAPVFLILMVTIGKLNLVNLYYPILFIWISSSFFIFLLIMFYFLLDFYFGFSLYNQVKNFIHYNKTKYANIIQIIYDEVKNYLDIPLESIEIYLVKDDSRKIYSLSYFKKGAIVLTTGVLDYIIEMVKKDSISPLMAAQGVFIHEISHIVNKDNIIGDFVKLNIVFTQSIILIYSLFSRFIIQITSILPLPYIRNGLGFAFSKVSSYALFTLSIFSKIMESMHYFLKRTLFQIQEKRCDNDIKKAIGETSLKEMLDIIGTYQNYYSYHTANINKRIAAVEKTVTLKEKPYFMSFYIKKCTLVYIFTVNMLSILILFKLLYLGRKIHIEFLFHHIADKFSSIYITFRYYFSYINKLFYSIKSFFI